MKKSSFFSKACSEQYRLYKKGGRVANNEFLKKTKIIHIYGVKLQKKTKKFVFFVKYFGQKIMVRKK